ncbi:MAG: subtilisin family serine protease [Limisphaerales bacterium]|jgi:subtilisin family serine protease
MSFKISYSISLLLILFSANNSVSAQSPQLGLDQIRESPSSNNLSTHLIPLMVQGDLAKIKSQVADLGGKWLYERGGISRISIPQNKLAEFQQTSQIERIAFGKAKLRALGDVVLINSRVDSVHAGSAPLSRAYTGKDVVVGVIDLGIDPAHEDFRDAAGNTRIKYIWDQNASTDASAPSPYSYGQECDSASIEALICAHSDPFYFYSHGSGVAGVAAGDGSSTDRYIGVAPESDLIIVNLDFGANFLGNVVDAIDYIFEKAEALGKPCVINTSVGTYLGSHDGNDLSTIMIENMLEEIPGRVVVAACGNAGNIPFHLGYEASDDTSFTWFENEPTLNAMYAQMWADTADFNDFYFSLRADDPSSWNSLGTSPWWNIKEDLNPLPGGAWVNLTYTLSDTAGEGGDLEIWAKLDDNRYLFEIIAYPTDPDLLWAFQTTGQGRFDCWSDPAYTGTSYMLSNADLPSATTYPQITSYTKPDTQMTMVSSWQNSDKVISVGSYYNRDTMTNYYGASPPISGTKGARINSSSNGPTRDFRIKPDISASGQWVLGAASSDLSSFLIGASAATYMAEGGKHYLQGGTSFSSPIVAGAVALYLERYPNADWNAVKDALLQGARSDGFTGTDLPDQYWGYGKLNAFEMMQVPFETCETPSGVTVSHLIDTGARVIWNPVDNAVGYELLGQRIGAPNWASLYAEGTVELVPGLLTGTDYQFKIRALCGIVDTSEWTTLNFFTTALSPKLSNPLVSFFELNPNPISQSGTINFNFDGINSAVFQLYDLPGNLIKTIHLEGNLGTAPLHVEGLPQGVYLYRVINAVEFADGNAFVIKTGKLIITP